MGGHHPRGCLTNPPRLASKEVYHFRASSTSSATINGFLVGGWTNPSEKILVKMGSSSPTFGVEVKNISHHRLVLWGGCLKKLLEVTNHPCENMRYKLEVDLNPLYLKMLGSNWWIFGTQPIMLGWFELKVSVFSAGFILTPVFFDSLPNSIRAVLILELNEWFGLVVWDWRGTFK